MTESQLNAQVASQYGDERSKQLATQPVSRLLLQFATPSIIAMAASSIYNICDSIFIGQGVNSMAIAGLAITFPLMNISSAFGAMAGVGGGAQVSVAMGEGNRRKALMIFGNVIRLDITIGLILTTLGLIFLDPILLAFGASDATLPYARDYMQIILAGNIITHTFLGMNDQLRATGNPRLAMQGQLIAVIANIVLDALFIFGFGWGMRGAALATILGQALAWVHNFRYFLNKEHFVHFSKEGLIFRLDIIREILAIGLSPFCVNVCACVVVMLINRDLLHYGGTDGDTYVGVYGIINRIAMLVFMCVQGFAQGMQPIVGFNLGARLFHRVLGTLKFAYVCATLITTFGYLFMAVFAAPLSRLFTSDPLMIQLCAPSLRTMLCMLPIVGGQMITGTFFQSIRQARKSIFISTTRQMLFLVPLLLFLPDILIGLGYSGVDGVWISFPIADVLSCTLAAAFLWHAVRKFRKLADKRLND
ncbi:MAG: MATE family efflux transporter [Bacteroidales bacterium]|nr:MATE family efflux transporter [Candidatus Liminaster caballi]